MQNQIEKVCRSSKSFLNELFVYQSDFPYGPELIEIKKPYKLVINKVEGIPYLDADVLSDKMITILARTISRFHSVTHLEDKVLCHWDNQPRNILWNEKKQKFCLLDFEDIRLARPEADLTHLFLFWAEVMSHADFSQAVQTFIKAYGKSRNLNSDLWQTEALKAKSRFDFRRRRYNKLPRIDNPDRRQNRRFLLRLQLV